MVDPILSAADYVSDTGDACFAGEGPEILVVHNAPFSPGDIYRSPDGTIAVKILRATNAQEFIDRCPQVPAADLNLDRCFFYVGVAD